MKVLYLTCYAREEYQSDTVFHGLREMFGADVVDAPKLSYMYKNYPDKSSLYGNGFTMFGLLDDIEVDRTDIEKKIKNHYFDYVVIGDVYRWELSRLYDFVKYFIGSYYNKNEVILIDGQDACSQSNNNHYIIEEILPYGMYFKREIYYDRDVESGEVLPISFGIPKEKISYNEYESKYGFAPLVPNSDKTGYIYKDEKSYYDMYERSLFAYTCCKGGFDCMRHLEIMAMQCIPFFLDIELCPKYTMYHYPKNLFIEAKKIRGVYPAIRGGYKPIESTLVKNPLWQNYFQRAIAADEVLPELGYVDYDKIDESAFYYLQREIFKCLKSKLTTDKIARYVLDRMLNNGRL